MIDSLEVHVLVDADPASVWEALADPEQLREWWPYIELEARPGGRLFERWRDASGDVEVTEGVVRAVDPPRRLHTTWRSEGWPIETDVEIHLSASNGSSTLVRVVHTGWEAFGEGAEELRRAHESGWRMHLDELKHFVESRHAGG